MERDNTDSIMRASLFITCDNGTLFPETTQMVVRLLECQAESSLRPLLLQSSDEALRPWFCATPVVIRPVI